jgi:hypothetical protein
MDEEGGSFGTMKDRPCRGLRLLLSLRSSPPNLNITTLILNARLSTTGQHSMSGN